MTFADVDGTDYLFIIGYDDTNTLNLQVISNLGAATPTRTYIGKYPFGANALGEGCDLEWDGEGYLYAIRGGNLAGFSRIAIPSDPTNVGSWGDWESLADPPWGAAWDTGSSVVRGVYDPPSQPGLAYYAAGTLTTGDVTIPGVPDAWGEVTWTEVEPASTTLSVKVQGWDGLQWDDLVTGATSPVDISGFSVATYTKIRLVGEFTTADDFATPRLDEWSVSATYYEWVTSGSLTCYNCHNTHYARTGSGVWDMTRASDPDLSLHQPERR